MAAVKEKVTSGKVLRPAPIETASAKTRFSSLIAAPYFVVEMFETKAVLSLATHDESQKSSVQILVAVEGCGVVEIPGAEPVTLTKGDAGDSGMSGEIQRASAVDSGIAAGLCAREDLP